MTDDEIIDEILNDKHLCIRILSEYYKGSRLTFEEIGSIIGITAEGVKRTYHNAIRHMYENFKSKGITTRTVLYTRQ